LAKITFFEAEEWEKEYLRNSLKGHALQFFDQPLSKKNINKVKDQDIIAVFIYSKMDKGMINGLPKLKLITTMSTGFDHIDIEESKKRGIVVCNVPSYGENTVAEHTFALILSISRKIPESLERVKKGDFSLKRLRGFDLKGKTIGIVGCGNIGQHVARIAKGFEMDVLVFDVNKDQKLAKKIGFRYSSLENLLKNSDIVTLHVPDNKSTHHLINKKTLSLLKKDAVLINTSRGGIIDTDALIKSLSKKKIRSAGLDVLEGECLIKEEKQLLNSDFEKVCDLKTVLQDHILLNNPNVYITPHNAFNSKEALNRILDTTVDNINAFLKKKPINEVV